MGLFDKLFGSKENKSVEVEIYAPISGEIVNIEDVPDVVFSEKIVGDGVAVRPIGNKIVAQERQSVKRGDTVIEFDLVLLESKAKSVLTPIVISNMDEISCIVKKSGEVVAGESVVLALKK